jgi:endoglucanase
MKRNLQIACGFLSIVFFIEVAALTALHPPSLLKPYLRSLSAAATSANPSTLACVSTDPSKVVTPPAPTQTPPTCTSFTATPASIHSGDTVTLSWLTSNATSITIDGGVGSVTPVAGGSTTVHPTSSVTYNATVANATSNVACQAQVTVASSGGGGGNGVPASRLRLLSRGMNADNSLDSIRLAPYGPDDIAKMKSMNITYARVDVDPNWLVTGLPIDSSTGTGSAGLSDSTRVAAGLARMDSLVANFSNAGLAVVVSVHPQNVLRALPAPQVEDAVMKAQDVITKRYANQYTPDQIFFEMQNEPHYDNATWNAFVPVLFAEMRQNAPNHTIIVPPAWWDLASNFKDLTPVNDPNVVYNMHVYYPPGITQQGAGQGPPDPNYFFPTPASGKTASGEATEAQVDAYIKVGVDWAAANHAPLIMGEFGSSNLVADKQSRLNWIKFVKATAEKYNVGWAWWGWDGRLFGVRPHNLHGAYDEDLVNILSQ